MREYVRFKRWNDLFVVSDILNMINVEKLNIVTISKKVGIPAKRLCEMLIFHKIDVPNKGLKISKEHNFFDVIDSEIKAYLLGYLIADGCVSIEPKKKNGVIYSYNKRVLFTVSVDDRSTIELFKEFVAPDAFIKEFHNPKGAKVRKNQLMLRISSPVLVDRLVTMGVKPRKTLDTSFSFDFNLIPESLRHHFIRGFFDGDGCVSNHAGVGFIFTSLTFLNQIKDEILKYDNSLTYRIRNCKGITVDWITLVFNSGYGKKDKIGEYLYKDATFYLERKRIKFSKIIPC